MLIVVFITCGPLYMQTAASGWGRGGPGQKAGERGLLPSLPCCVSLGAWRASLSAGCCSLEGPGGPDGVVSSHVASTLPAAPLPRSGLAAVGPAWGLLVRPGGCRKTRPGHTQLRLSLAGELGLGGSSQASEFHFHCV